MRVLPLTAIQDQSRNLLPTSYASIPIDATNFPAQLEVADEPLDKTQSKTITFKPTERTDGSHEGGNTHAAWEDGGNEFSSGSLWHNRRGDRYPVPISDSHSGAVKFCGAIKQSVSCCGRRR